MTPEKRALALVNDLGYQWTPNTVSIVSAAFHAAMEDCALACDAISDDKHAQFKGRPPHAPNNDHRGDTYTEGESDGADLCAAAIRARTKD